jgi:HTH-type transcriptional regulator / antitoxin HigA
MKSIKLIKTEEDYSLALKKIDSLFDAESDTEKGDELELLVTLVEIYEKDHFPISNPSPLEAIKFRMDQMSLTPKDLIQYIGSKSKVSEVLSGKRTLSLTMIRRLNEGLGIPAEVLIQPYGNEVKKIA